MLVVPDQNRVGSREGGKRTAGQREESACECDANKPVHWIPVVNSPDKFKLTE
jgi:hypothetical protein